MGVKAKFLLGGFLIFLASVVVVLSVWLVEKSGHEMITDYDSKVFIELRNLGIKVKGEPEIVDQIIPLSIASQDAKSMGPEWGVLRYTCSQGGYDLAPYVGKSISSMIFALDSTGTESFAEKPSRVKVLAYNDTIICVIGLVPDSVPGLIPFRVHPSNDSGSETMCSAEAMLCPDGSSVGRVGPNCEFAPCPSTKETDIITIPDCSKGPC